MIKEESFSYIEPLHLSCSDLKYNWLTG